MSGLILAGLGRGISEAGSSIGKAMMMDLADQRAEERQIRAEERKIKLADELEEKKAQKAIADYQKVKTRAGEIASEREMGDIVSAQQQVGGESPAMSESEISKLLKENPEYRGVLKRGGIIKSRMDERLQSSDDLQTAAMELGVGSRTLEALQKKRDSVLDEIKQEARERKDDAAAQTAQTRAEAMMKQAVASGVRAEASKTRANTAAAGGKTRVSRTYENSAGNMVAVFSDGTEKELGRTAAFNKQVANVIKDMEAADYQFSKLSTEEKRSQAIERLTGGYTPKTTSSSGQAGGGSNRDYSTLWK